MLAHGTLRPVRIPDWVKSGIEQFEARRERPSPGPERRPLIPTAPRGRGGGDRASQRRRYRDRQRPPAGPRERVTLELSGVAHGGEAIGRHEGRVFFVPYGLPGETVVAEIVQDKPDFARAEIVELLEASPDRVTAPCAYFGTCGGCNWQHASYEAQLRFKRGIVAEQLRRIGHFEDADGLVLPTIGMAEPWHYRNHARFTVGRRFGELCFTRSGTRQLLRIDHCWLMQPPDRRDPGPTPAPAGRLPRPPDLDPRRRQHRRHPDQAGAARAWRPAPDLRGGA